MRRVKKCCWRISRPDSSIIARDLATVYYYARDFNGALERCREAIELDPHFTPAYWTLGIVQEQMDDLDEAAATFERAIQLSPQSPTGMPRLAARWRYPAGSPMR